MRSILFYCNLFWLLFSLFICVESYRLKLGSIHSAGPGFFPFGAGLIMLILSLVAFFQLTTGRKKVEKMAPQEPIRWWNIVIILVAITVYAFSLEKIGFLINTFLFICLMLKVVEPQTWRTAIIGGLITSIAANFVFNVIFQTHIPRGILGF